MFHRFFGKNDLPDGKSHEIPLNHLINPHEITIFLWFSYGFAMGMLELRQVLGPGQRLHRGAGQWGAFRAAQRPPKGAWLGDENGMW